MLHNSLHEQTVFTNDTRTYTMT